MLQKQRRLGYFAQGVSLRAIKLQSFKRDFENLKMRDGELLNDYFTRIMDIVNQMKIHEEDVIDKRIVENILMTLPAMYDPTIGIIEQTQNLETLGVEELMGFFKAFDERSTRRSENTIESTLQTQLNIGSKNQEKSILNFDQGKAGFPRGEGYGDVEEEILEEKVGIIFKGVIEKIPIN